MTKKSDNPRSQITTFKQTKSEFEHLNEMSVGNRSEFIRRLIEAEYQKRQEQK